jgi:hypothetical protein
MVFVQSSITCYFPKTILNEAFRFLVDVFWLDHILRLYRYDVYGRTSTGKTEKGECYANNPIQTYNYRTHDLRMFECAELGKNNIKYSFSIL